jgi:hypothetical protein
MYNLISNNRLIWGPIAYSKARFEDALQELEINYTLPYSTDDAIIIDETTGIYPTLPIITPDNDPLFEQLVGPTFTIVDNKVQYIYTKQDRNLDHIKSDMQSIIAENRWKYETAGITISVQNNLVWIPTAKGDRDIFLQSMQLGVDNVNWKFDKVWLTIINADLVAIVAAILAKIQSCFDWEATKVLEINACNTMAELKQLELINPEWELKTSNVELLG